MIGNKIPDEEIAQWLQLFEERSLANSFLERKLKKLLRIYRLLFKQCEKSISKRVLLQLISFQILQITSSNENNNDQNYEEQQKKNKKMIEMRNKLIEFIISKKNLKSEIRNHIKLICFLKGFNKK